MTNNQSKEMEQEANKYYFGKIYKITSPHTDKIYIGSTIQTLKKRFYKHESDKYNSCLSRELFIFGDCEIVLVEDYPCIYKKELLIREGKYILNTPNCINKLVAGRTKKETNKLHYLQNKKYYNDKAKLYRSKNREYINNRKRDKFLCECGIYYTRDNKRRHERTKRHMNNI